jgi:hypothetical protein
MWNMAHEALCDNGLSFTAVPTGERVWGIMSHSSGQYIGGWLDIKLVPNKYGKYDPQDLGEWITYLSKYLFKAALNLPTDDTDATGLRGNAAKQTGEPIEKPKPPDEPDILGMLVNATGMSEADVKSKLKKHGLNTITKIKTFGFQGAVKILKGETDES